MKAIFTDLNRKYLFVQVAIFLICFFLIAYYNRLTGDDFCGISAVNNHGVFGATKELYCNWEGAYAQGIVYYFFCDLFQNSTSLFSYNLIILCCLAFSFSFFIFTLLKNYFMFLISKTEAFVIALILIGALYFSTSEFGEIWYWLCGSSSYLMPLVFLFFAFGIASTKSKSFISIVLVIILIFLFSGFRVNYTLTLILGLFLLMMFDFFKTKKINRMFLLMLIVAVVGLIVFMAAPGNSIRLSKYDNGLGMMGRIKDFHFFTMVKGLGGFILMKALHTFYLFIILFPLVLLGLNNFYFEYINKIRTHLLRVFFSFFVLLVVNFLLMYLATGSYFGTSSGSYRTLFLFDFLWLLIIVLLMFDFCLQLKKYFKRDVFVKPLIKLSIVFISFTPFLVKICFASTLLPNYAYKYDQRNSLINSASLKNEAHIVVNKLPQATFSFNLFDEKKPIKYLFVGIPGNLLFLNDAKTDSTNWVNGCMEDRYRGIKIRIQEE